MGRARRIGAWTRQLSRKTNCSRQLARPGIDRIRGEPVLWTHVLVKPAGTERARNRSRKGIGPEMAACALDRHLRLQGGSARHGRRAWLKLSTLVYYPVGERSPCQAGDECQIF